MRKFCSYIIHYHFALWFLFYGCTGSQPTVSEKKPDKNFTEFTERFIENLWRLYPEWASDEGFHNYDTVLSVPDKEYRERELVFCRSYTDSLKGIDMNSLALQQKADYLVIENELASIEWSTNEFREYEWNPAMFNIAGTFDDLLKSKHYSGAEKIRALYLKMRNIPEFYLQAQNNIHNPTIEHTKLAIEQHQGTLYLFDKEIRDSINKVQMGEHERQMAETMLNKSIQSIRDYSEWLEKAVLPKLKPENAHSCRIGKEHFFKKFAFDIGKALKPVEAYRKAVLYKVLIQDEMIIMCMPLWKKYFPRQPLPDDKLIMVKKIIDTLSVKHARRDSLLSAIRRQIPELINYVNNNNLLHIDTTRPLVVRATPEYMQGVTVASVESPGLYEKHDTTYYNVSPLDGYSDAEAESYLREYNDKTLQILNIHEAVPGHYVQLMYCNESKSMVSKILQNGAMVEGWAVYTERMMMEEGFGNSPRGSNVMDTAMWLLYDKWHLRVICNTILDYGIHVLGMSETDGMNLLVNEAFQQETEAREKWKRASLTQVQLCSYFCGYLEIYSMREHFKDCSGDGFNLKRFHEKFLSYGSIPAGIIRQLMVEENVMQAENCKK